MRASPAFDGVIRWKSERNVLVYPTLTRKGVLAAIKYAVDVLCLDVVYPIGA